MVGWDKFVWVWGPPDRYTLVSLELCSRRYFSGGHGASYWRSCSPTAGRLHKVGSHLTFKLRPFPRESAYRDTDGTLRCISWYVRSPTWEKFSILQRGEFGRRLNGDRHLRIIQIDCRVYHAKRLLEPAKRIYPKPFRISNRLLPPRGRPSVHTFQPFN